MTYPETRTLLTNARTTVQDALHRIDVLQPELIEARTIGGDLLGQIPDDGIGDPVEAPEEFAAAAQAASDLSTTLAARILPE